ncbi:MAG: M20/M25/M40 family metallo-hydrolase [Crocinitomicaceae bacterium]
MNFSLLNALTAVRGASGDESRIKQFILNHVQQNKSNWVTEPKIIEGDGFQDTLTLVFGDEPTTAIFAHIDSIGYCVGYDNSLIKIGGPCAIDGMELVGSDSISEIETELMVIEQTDGTTELRAIFDRTIERGTVLTFKPNYRDEGDYIVSPYMDNRLGVWVALEIAKTLKNGAIAFSTYEETGGGSVGYIGKFLYETYRIHQALISDITWVTNGVKHGEGVAISMRDKGIPRKVFLDKIIDIAKHSRIPFQLEVESAGGSDGTALQHSDMPFDWCFIGAAENNVHSPNETVHKADIRAMVDLYRVLMEEL